MSTKVNGTNQYKLTYQVGVAENKNSKFRKAMEDVHTYVKNLVWTGDILPSSMDTQVHRLQSGVDPIYIPLWNRCYLRMKTPT